MPDLRAGIHDQKCAAALLKLPSDRQAGLAGADHDHLDNCIRWLVDRCNVGRHGGLLGMVCWLVTSVGPAVLRRTGEVAGFRRRQPCAAAPSGVLLGHQTLASCGAAGA